MSLFSNSLRSQLSRYRKRKTISVDGAVPGLGPLRHGTRHYAVPQDGWLGAGSSDSQRSIYDATAHYHYPDEEYQEPQAWFDGAATRGTPRLKLDPPERGPFPPRPRYLRMTDEAMEQAMQHLPQPGELDTRQVVDEFGYPTDLDDQDAADIYASDPLPMLDDDELAMQMLGGQVFMEDEDHPWYGESDLTQEMFDDAVAGVLGTDDSAEAGYGALAAPEGCSDFTDDDPWQVDSPAALGEDDTGSAAYAEAPMQADLGDAEPAEAWLGEPAGFDAGVDEDAMPQDGFDAYDHSGLEMAVEEAYPMEMMQAQYEQQLEQGLEALVQEAIPEPMQEPDPMQQMYDEEMMDPWMMPGPFGPGPGFGPMGPMPGP